MRRVWFGLPVIVVSMALLATACAPPPQPAGLDWKVSPVSVTVHDGEDNDGGDEPYIIQLGFRSKLGVPGSSTTSVSSQCYRNKLPVYNAAPNGTTLPIPTNAADIMFPDVRNLDLIDLAAETAPFELLGTVTLVMERDAVTGGCAVSDLVRDGLRGVIKDALELLIANSPVPPTTEQLVDLLVSNLRDFVYALGSLIGAVLEGLGNPDDIIGIGAQIHVPTKGSLTDLVNAALDVAGLFVPGLENGFIPVEELPNSLKIRVGTLSNSRANFRFTTPWADYGYVSSISRTDLG